jgi:hypothetical protein
MVAFNRPVGVVVESRWMPYTLTMTLVQDDYQPMIIDIPVFVNEEIKVKTGVKFEYLSIYHGYLTNSMISSVIF